MPLTHQLTIPDRESALRSSLGRNPLSFEACLELNKRRQHLKPTWNEAPWDSEEEDDRRLSSSPRDSRPALLNSNDIPPPKDEGARTPELVPLLLPHLQETSSKRQRGKRVHFEDDIDPSLFIKRQKTDAKEADPSARPIVAPEPRTAEEINEDESGGVNTNKAYLTGRKSKAARRKNGKLAKKANTKPVRLNKLHDLASVISEGVFSRALGSTSWETSSFRNVDPRSINQAGLGSFCSFPVPRRWTPPGSKPVRGDDGVTTEEDGDDGHEDDNDKNEKAGGVTQKQYFYFSYGPLMSLNVVKRILPGEVEAVGIARLDDYRFLLCGPQREGVHGQVEPTPSHQSGDLSADQPVKVVMETLVPTPCIPPAARAAGSSAGVKTAAKTVTMRIESFKAREEATVALPLPPSASHTPPPSSASQAASHHPTAHGHPTIVPSPDRVVYGTLYRTTSTVALCQLLHSDFCSTTAVNTTSTAALAHSLIRQVPVQLESSYADPRGPRHWNPKGRSVMLPLEPCPYSAGLGGDFDSSKKPNLGKDAAKDFAADFGAYFAAKTASEELNGQPAPEPGRGRKLAARARGCAVQAPAPSTLLPPPVPLLPSFNLPLGSIIAAHIIMADPAVYHMPLSPPPPSSLPAPPPEDPAAKRARLRAFRRERQQAQDRGKVWLSQREQEEVETSTTTGGRARRAIKKPQRYADEQQQQKEPQPGTEKKKTQQRPGLAGEAGEEVPASETPQQMPPPTTPEEDEEHQRRRQAEHLLTMNRAIAEAELGDGLPENYVSAELRPWVPYPKEYLF